MTAASSRTHSSAGVCFFSSRRRHTRCSRDWSSDVCSSDLVERLLVGCLIIHAYHCLRCQFPLKVPDLVSPHGRIPLQVLVSYAVSLQQLCDDVDRKSVV